MKVRLLLRGLSCFMVVLSAIGVGYARVKIAASSNDAVIQPGQEVTAGSDVDDGILPQNVSFIIDGQTHQSYDINGDGTVNVLDMIILAQHWGETGTNGWLPEDINNDGVVDILDMILVGQNQTKY